MDPNAALQNARDAMVALAVATSGNDVDPETILDAAADLAEAVRSLDEWLTGGGFPPDAWLGKRPVPSSTETDS